MDYDLEGLLRDEAVAEAIEALEEAREQKDAAMEIARQAIETSAEILQAAQRISAAKRPPRKEHNAEVNKKRKALPLPSGSASSSSSLPLPPGALQPGRQPPEPSSVRRFA